MELVPYNGRLFFYTLEVTIEGKIETEKLAKLKIFSG
jgi:hypothetical protein